MARDRATCPVQRAIKHDKGTNIMSTFDTMMDWEDGQITTITALAECVTNLADWNPSVIDQEAFQAICKLVEDLTDGAWTYHPPA